MYKRQEQAQEGEPLQPERESLGFHVAERVTGDARPAQLGQDVHRLLDRSGHHLFAARHPSPDLLGVLGMRLGQTSTRSGRALAPVMRFMPLGRADPALSLIHI